MISTFGVGLGVVVASSCVAVNYPTVAFRCNPRQADNCPDTHFCCSDDPAAEDGELPDFDGNGATPFFAGQNNTLSTSGMCVNRDDIPPGAGLTNPNAVGCPIPCNPTWSNSEISAVCGASRLCCQTVALEVEDCVEEENRWRPVRGTDIGSSTVSPRTSWAASNHATHQDPGGSGCLTFAGGMNSTFEDCVNNLTVANQRGFCLGNIDACPAFTDACTAINEGLLPEPI